MNLQMKILFYFLTVIFGFYGALGVFRPIERLVTGQGVLPAEILIAFVALSLAFVFLGKARGVKPRP